MEIHYFDVVIPVPFLVGLATIIFILAATFIITAKVISIKWFVCDKCGTRFKPKWYRALFKPCYSDGTTILKCPNCKKNRACSESYKQD